MRKLIFILTGTIIGCICIGCDLYNTTPSNIVKEGSTKNFKYNYLGHIYEFTAEIRADSSFILISGQSDAAAVEAILNSPNAGMLQDPIDSNLLWIYQNFNEFKKYSNQYYSRCPKSTSKRGSLVAEFYTDYAEHGDSFGLYSYDAHYEMPEGFENAVSSIKFNSDAAYIFVFEKTDFNGKWTNGASILDKVAHYDLTYICMKRFIICNKTWDNAISSLFHNDESK